MKLIRVPLLARMQHAWRGNSAAQPRQIMMSHNSQHPRDSKLATQTALVKRSRAMSTAHIAGLNPTLLAKDFLRPKASPKRSSRALLRRVSQPSCLLIKVPSLRSDNLHERLTETQRDHCKFYVLEICKPGLQTADLRNLRKSRMRMPAGKHMSTPVLIISCTLSSSKRKYSAAYAARASHSSDF